MSHKVSTTLDDDMWAALDRFREQQGLVSDSAALRRLVERLAAEEIAEIKGAGQMLSVHPTLAPRERCWDDEDMMRESFASRMGHPGGHYG